LANTGREALEWPWEDDGLGNKRGDQQCSNSIKEFGSVFLAFRFLFTF
jgi:hypothetical protein